MEITTTTIHRNSNRRAAVNALALVGFIVLIIIGILLAVYSTRIAPKFASRIGGAAATLFGGSEDENPTLNVVTATSSLPILDAEPIVATTTEVTSEPTKTSTHTSSGNSGSTHTQTVVTTTTTPAPLYGDADLSVSINDTGYLRSGSDVDTFVASNDFDNDKEGAVRFTVTNNGTNESGRWEFKAEIPTSPSYTYTSPTQPSLKPGDSIVYTLGFTKGKEGDNREITITVDSGHDVRESNENNNDDSARVDINN